MAKVDLEMKPEKETQTFSPSRTPRAWLSVTEIQDEGRAVGEPLRAASGPVSREQPGAIENVAEASFN